MIEVRGLTKTFARHHAVTSLRFSVEAGKIVGFLGPNGAGKTTTLRMITGFLEPTAGDIKVRGIDAIRQPIQARRHIGYMPEGVPLYPEMRVEEYLRYRAGLKGIRPAQKAVERSLKQAQVADVAGRIIGQLSKGYRQRVGLADALLADPPILILDEPTSGLDPNQIREFRRLVRGFAGEKTVLLSTHILSEVEASCDEVIVIHRGRIVKQGGLDEIQSSRTLRLIVRREAADASDSIAVFLRDIAGVQSVAEDSVTTESRNSQSTAPILEFVLSLDATRDPGDVAELVFKAVVDRGLVLRELTQAGGGTLEEVFAALTRDEDMTGRSEKSAASASEDEA